MKPQCKNVFIGGHSASVHEHGVVVRSGVSQEKQFFQKEKSFELALDRRRILIPEITDEGIGTLAFDDEKVLARDVRDFLNIQTARLQKDFGIQVDRLSMLPSVFQTNSGGQLQGVFFSPEKYAA